MNIGTLGAQIEQKRLALIIANAALTDAKAAAHDKRMAEKLPVTTTQLWIKRDCLFEELAVYTAEQEVRILAEKIEISKEVVNALKSGIKIIELEVHNQI